MKLFKIWFLSIVSLSLILAAGAAFAQGSPVNTSDSLLLRIKALPGVYVKRIDPLPGFKESFEIALVQPVDHQNPNGSKFTQRMFLAHKDHSKPVLVETEGYGATWQKSKELSKLLDCNQIIVEHRYFDSSKPDPLNWKYLTIKQAASDHHRVIQIFKEIYKSKWITSGRSKGGMAALFHKYYYPEDVDATVAYVAPIMIGLQDPRFYEFLEMKGTEELRQKIRNIQKALLRRKNDILPIFKEYAKNDGITYSLDPEIVFEYMVAAYPFSFWQGKKNPDSIPDSTSTDIELIDHLSSIVSFSTYSVSTLN
ncbi:MAG: peptidase, partial [bacterium]|nr:peptidase [bacterium]